MIHDNNAASAMPIGAGSLAGVPSLVATAGPSSRHVLIVEDDPALCRLLACALLGEGYRVTCAGDGEHGWDELCRSSFDAMITDHEMPRLTGVGLIRRVRAGPSRLPVILISGAMPWGDVDLDRLLPPGVAIDKPFELQKFLVTVAATLGGPHYSDAHPGSRNEGCAPSRPPGRERSVPGDDRVQSPPDAAAHA